MKNERQKTNQKEPSTMEDFVYQKLKNAIYKRYIRPNSQLVENTIGEQMGVSRTPVRGAIKRLVYEGFVRLVPNKGAFVIQPTAFEIKQAFDVRIILETMSAELACNNIKTGDVLNLKRLIQEEKKIFQKKDLNSYYSVNDNFHLTIAKASGNSILLQYVQDIINRTNVYLILFDPFYQREINPSMNEHSRIVEALSSRDAGEAKKSMELHLNSALKGMRLEKTESNAPDDYLFL